MANGSRFLTRSVVSDCPSGLRRRRGGSVSTKVFHQHETELREIVLCVHNVPAIRRNNNSPIYRFTGGENWRGLPDSRLRNSISSIADPGCHEGFGPTHLTLRIVAQATTLRYATLGAAYPSSEGTGVYSDVFYDRIQRLSLQDRRVSPSCILGHVLAHEIGHLLLGLNAHSVTGIMRTRWREHELAQAAMGALLFLPEQGKLMRARLIPLNTREETARISTRSAPEM